MKISQLVILVFSIGFYGCSGLIHRTAIGTTGELLTKASGELWQESDLKLVNEGVPGNIKLIEGLLYVKPEDSNLLASLVKAYAGYGFVRYETDLIKSQILDEEDSDKKELLEKAYSRSIFYGFRFLSTYGVESDSLFNNLSNEEVVLKELDKVPVNIANLEALFFLGQSLCSMILLNRDNLRMVAQRPLVNTLFKWVCERKPDINGGSCLLFEAMNLSMTPVMLGGNPEKGKIKFLEAIDKFPDNWILRTALLRYHSIPQEDEDEFAAQSKFFQKVSKDFNSQQIYRPGQTKKVNKWALFQSLALKRYEIINSLKSELF